MSKLLTIFDQDMCKLHTLRTRVTHCISKSPTAFKKLTEPRLFAETVAVRGFNPSCDIEPYDTYNVVQIKPVRKSVNKH